MKTTSMNNLKVFLERTNIPIEKKYQILSIMILNEFHPMEIPACPHCNSKEHIVKHGNTATGQQRFLCKACRKTFSSQAQSVLRGSKIPLEKWLRFALCSLKYSKIKTVAAKCKITSKTASSMGKRVEQLFNEYLSDTQKVERLKKSYDISQQKKREKMLTQGHLATPLNERSCIINTPASSKM